MKTGTENKRQRYIAAVLGVLALLAIVRLYNGFFGEDTAPAVQAPPVIRDATVRGGQPATGAGGKLVSTPPGFAVGGPNAAQRVGKSDSALDPTLHMEAMLVTESLRYSGSGRNIFGGEAPAPILKQAVIEKPRFDPRPTSTVQTPVNFGSPPKPAINLKFFGTETNSSGMRRAFLLNGDDVYLASPGDVVQRRYRVISIAVNSIQVEDIPNDNKQTLPLVN